MKKSLLYFSIALSIFFYNSCKNNTNEVAFTYYQKGLAKDSVKDYQGAIQDFTKAIELLDASQPWPWPYYKRGLAKINLKDFSGALKDFEKATDIGPGIIRFYRDRGLAKDSLNDHQGAIHDYNLAKNPNEYTLSDTLEIIKEYDKIISHNPKHALAFYMRGSYKAAFKDFSGAIQDWNKAKEYNPSLRNGFYYELGRAKMEIKDFRGAIEDFNKSGMKTTESFYARGKAKYALKDYDGALEDFNTLIKYVPNDGSYLLARGNARHELGDKVGAISDWKRVGDYGDSIGYVLIKKYYNN